ncbi:MtnX-like HAD-IB family phosphatase [bacterium]|nr:MtnX-like HAD-IB family phosphatase [bacterium]
MTADSSPWIVVSDFDGTITTEDIGNGLCQKFRSELFTKVIHQYELGNMNLRAEQHILWKGFPLGEAEFKREATQIASFRPLANEFLEKCATHKIPVYIASCGMRPYIDAVLSAQASPKALQAIKEIRCNEVEFDKDCIVKLITPIEDEKNPLPFHKGEWAKQLSQKHGGSKVLIIGDGSSDFSMIDSADQIYATRKLAKKCKEKGLSFTPFEDFAPLLESPLFS